MGLTNVNPSTLIVIVSTVYAQGLAPNCGHLSAGLFRWARPHPESPAPDVLSTSREVGR
jgi:hypothetical protein